MTFEFATTNRIVFGAGALKGIGKIARELGRKALITSGLHLPSLVSLEHILEEAGVWWVLFQVSGEPTIDSVKMGVVTARQAQCDVIIGFGGGSAIDTAKAVAALLTNPGDPLDYLEVIGKGKSITHWPLPVLAIPTTAGTGSEVTRNAVLTSPEERVKVSLRSPMMLPKVALVDPELTLPLPAPVTATTGMDALAQLIEPFVSVKANPVTDGFCREGIPRVARSLVKAYRDGENLEARTDMSLAALFGGLALANAGLGAVHGFAAPIGGMFPAPHGAVCARLLPAVQTANIRAVEEREPESTVLMRYAEIARMLTGDEGATVKDGIRWLEELSSELSIPPLRDFGMTPEDIPTLVEKGTHASSMKANPIELRREELAWILNQAL